MPPRRRQAVDDSPKSSMMDAPTKSGVKKKTASSSRPRTTNAPTKSGIKNKRATGSSSQPRQLTPQEHWARGLEMYKWLPQSWLKKGDWMSHEEFENYMNKATESDGFDVSGCTGLICGGIGEVVKEQTLEEARNAAKYAVEKNNADTGANLKFYEMVKSNFSLAAVTVFYITLKVLNEQDQQLLIRAKVLKDARSGTAPDKKYTLRSFDPAPGQEAHGQSCSRGKSSI